MRNQTYADNAQNLRQAMLDGLHETITLKELSKLVLANHPDLKATVHNLNYHMDYLIDEGYVKQMAHIKINHARAYTFQAIKFEYKLPETYATRKLYEARKESEPVIKGAVLIKLTDKFHHARMPHKQRSAWIGSTMSTMVF